MVRVVIKSEPGFQDEYRIDLIKKLMSRSQTFKAHIDDEFGTSWRKKVDVPWSEIPRIDPALIEIVEHESFSPLEVVKFRDDVPYTIRVWDNAVEYIEPDWKVMLQKTLKGKLSPEEKILYEKVSFEPETGVYSSDVDDNFDE